MPIADDVVKKLRRVERGTVEGVLADSYPAVHRMAHALAGNSRLGQRIVRVVLRQALRVMGTWRKGIIPENWFYHHTLLTAREVAQSGRSAERDLLVTAGPTGEPAYVAFVRALRGLPRQQMEAFLLHHGEKLNARLLGVAMDCSTQAASTHLAAATDALQQLGGDQFHPLTDTLANAYTALTPAETVLKGTVQKQVSAAVWSQRVRRLIRRLVLLAVLATLAYIGWKWRQTLLQWFDQLRSKAQTRGS